MTVTTVLGCAGAAAPNARPVAAVVLCADDQTLDGGRCVAASAVPASAVASVSARPPLRRPTLSAAPGHEGLAPLVGRWLGEDSNGAALYRLTIRSDGHFEQEIETSPSATGRSPGTCLQVGHARVEDDQLYWFFEQNTCNTDFENREDPDRLAEYGPRSFTLDAEGSYQVIYTRQ